MTENIYIDCEFTNFHGQLLSIALVPESDQTPFYCVLDVSESEISPWSLINVVPKLNRFNSEIDIVGSREPRDREWAARAVTGWLRGFDHANIIADWPEDLSHFLNLLTYRPGVMVATPNLSLEYRTLPKFSAAKMSEMPHNALYDAIALRDYCKSSSS